MRLHDRVARLAETLPDGASVTLPVATLREWLADAERQPADRTVKDVARELGRDPSTVRNWIREGLLETYRLGREHRITDVALRAFLEGKKTSRGSSSRGRQTPRASLSSWRRLRAEQSKAASS